MTRTLIPRCGKTVDSQDFEKYWSCDIITDYVKSGFTVAAQCPNALAVDASTGIGRLKGLYIENTTACENVTCLTMCDINFIYVTISRTACVPTGWTYTTNTTGITPTDSLFIATATTNATTVTEVCNTHETRPINLGIAADQVYPLNTTIGCYAVPCSATSTSDEVTNQLCDTLTSACNWVECCCNTDITYSACCDRFDFNVTGSGTNIDDITHDLGALQNRSIYRGKMRFSTLTSCMTQNARFVVALSSVQTNHETCGDWAGFDIIAQTGCACPHGTIRISDNSDYIGGATTKNFCWVPVVCTDYFWKIDLDTPGDSFSVSIYTAACCMCLVETQTITCGDAITLDCIRYLHIETRTSTTNANTIAGFVDCIIADEPNPAINTIDCSNTSKWLSTCENNPAIFVDTGCPVKELPSIALNICTTSTTETKIKIRTSTTCCCFTDCDNVRTINISDFTDDTDRFITLPRTLVDTRYIQIIGNSCCAVLAINEIKYDTQTAAVIDKGHFHKLLSSTSTDDNSLDSN